MANTEKLREAVDEAVQKVTDARNLREIWEREVAERTEALQAGIRALVAAEAAEEAAEHEAEYAHEVLQDTEIALHEEWLASQDW